MHDISEIFSLSQSVTEPTHKHGHLLDLFFHRYNQCLIHSTCLDCGLTSDHIAVLCQLDIPKPAVQPVTTQFRSISKIDKNSFRQDLAQSTTPLTPISDFNRQLCCVLDKHALLCHRTVRQRKPTPWFSSIAEQFCKLKRERRRAERCWLKSKLTVHKQIYENIKRKVIDLVDNAKTAFYSFKIQTSSSCKELFHSFNAILGKKNSTPLPSSLDSDDIPQAFSEYFTNKIITIRNSFPPLNPTVAMDKTTYSGKLLHQSLNNLFRKFSRRLSPNHAILIPFLQNCCTKTLMFSSLQSPTSSTLHWLLVLYHQTSKLLLSNPCSKNPPSVKMY